MADSIAQRIFLAHLELSYRLGRKVTQAELGELIARAMRRDAPFTAAAVSRWEAGTKVPSVQIIEAIAAVTHTDPGWISHGSRSAAPRPRAVATPPNTPVDPRVIDVDVPATPVTRKISPRKRRGR
jgi:transcriptional regulator with XRE-family HTH domain